MPEGVDMTKMMDSFPLGRVSVMAGDAASPEMIEGLIAMANAGSAPASGARVSRAAGSRGGVARRSSVAASARRAPPLRSAGTRAAPR